ncbi:hypothetical protein KAU13_06890, partial [candidate division WOR-3 bacterium]|nr:hypothetical protein [candidate division WOR-3 bacterium]
QVHKSQEHQLQVKRKKVKKFYKTIFELTFNFDFSKFAAICLYYGYYLDTKNCSFGTVAVLYPGR